MLVQGHTSYVSTPRLPFPAVTLGFKPGALPKVLPVAHRFCAPFSSAAPAGLDALA